MLITVASAEPQPQSAVCPSCPAHSWYTFPLNITVAQLSFSFFRTKTMFPGRTCSSSAVSGMNSYMTRCGCPLRALGVGAVDRSGMLAMLLFYIIGRIQTSASLFLPSPFPLSSGGQLDVQLRECRTGLCLAAWVIHPSSNLPEDFWGLGPGWRTRGLPTGRQKGKYQ